jgi:hypothetical protein
MVRDPRDRYASVKNRYENDRGRVGAATGKWWYSAFLAKRNEENFPNNYTIITYEDLVQEPEATLSSICDFIDEEFSPQMLTMRGAPLLRDMGGNSSFDRFEPGEISTKSVGRFNSALTPSEILFIQKYTASYMKEFGYHIKGFNLPLKEQVRFNLIDQPVNIVRMISWLGREAIRDRIGRKLPEERMIYNLDSPGTA